MQNQGAAQHAHGTAQPIEFIVDYQEAEIRRAMAFYILRVRGIRGYAVLAYGAMAAGAALAWLLSDYGLVLSAAFLVLGYLAYYFYYRRPIEGYLKYHQMRGRVTYRIGHDKVSSAREGVRSEYLWTEFKNAWETPSAFLLTDAHQTVSIFPKTCLGGDVEIGQMRALLAEKFPRLVPYDDRLQ